MHAGIFVHFTFGVCTCIFLPVQDYFLRDNFSNFPFCTNNSLVIVFFLFFYFLKFNNSFATFDVVSDHGVAITNKFSTYAGPLRGNHV